MASNIHLKQPGSHLMSLGPIALTVLISISVAYWLGTKNIGIPFTGTGRLAGVVDKDERIKLLEKLVKLLVKNGII